MAVMSPMGAKKKKASALQAFLRRATKGSKVGDIGEERKRRDDQLKGVMDEMNGGKKKKK